jgi:hypothetical protein
MPSFELVVRGPIPRSHFLGRPVDQIAIVIAAHMDGVERDQHVHRPSRVERAARHVSEVDNFINALDADIGDDGLKRQIISVHVGNRGKAHLKH